MPLLAASPRQLPPPCAPRQLLVADTKTKTEGQKLHAAAATVSCKRWVGVGRRGRLCETLVQLHTEYKWMVF